MRRAGPVHARLLVVVLILCAQPLAAATHPRSLTVVPDGPVHVLAEDFVAAEKAATFTLRAGRYLTLFEDRSGYYLLGDADCLEMHVVPPKQPEHAYTMRFDCGVHLPKSATEPARFFYIREPLPEQREFGLIINAIIKAGEGSFNYPISAQRVIGLRERLSVAAGAR